MLNVFRILLIAGIIVIFSVQNEVPVTVSFLFWKFETSLVSVAAAAVFAGVLIAQLLAGLRAKRQMRARKSLEYLSRRHRWLG